MELKFHTWGVMLYTPKDRIPPPYFWPNKNNLINCAYVLLFDVMLLGPILIPQNTSIRFINHDYTKKHYFFTPINKHIDLLKHLIRRLNVHYIYFSKARMFFGLWVIFPLGVVSALSLFQEFCSLFFDTLHQKIIRLFK